MTHALLDAFVRFCFFPTLLIAASVTLARELRGFVREIRSTAPVVRPEEECERAW